MRRRTTGTRADRAVLGVGDQAEEDVDHLLAGAGWPA